MLAMKGTNRRSDRSMLPLTPHIDKQTFSIGVFVFPLILTFCFWLLKMYDGEYYYWLNDEDNLVENLEFLFYFIAFPVALYIGIRFFKTRNNLLGFFYSALALALFFVAMEEISWGQRIFSLATPAFFEAHNYQHELTVHNLEGTFHAGHVVYIVCGFVGAFAWLILPALPAKIKANYDSVVNHLVPSWYLTFYFLPVGLMYLYFLVYEYVGEWFLDFSYDDQEPAELLLSLGLLLFVITNMYRQSLENTSGPVNN